VVASIHSVPTSTLIVPANSCPVSAPSALKTA